MKSKIITVLLFATTIASAADLEPVVVIGTPVADRAEAWKDHVNFVAWIDDDTMVFAGESGFIKCYSVREKSERWAKTIDAKIRQLDAGNGRLFLLDAGDTVHVLAAAKGETVKRLGRKDLEAIAGADFLIPNNLAWVPGRNALMVSMAAEGYGDNSFLLDGESFKLLGRVGSDGFVTDVCVTRDGSHVVARSHADTIRIWSMGEAREVFKMGKGKGIVIDGEFISNATFDGKGTLVYSVDNSWATGTVHLHDIRQGKEIARFDSRNGHLEMDVDFASSRIALTGTSKELVIVGFDGRPVGARKNASDQRIVAVKFSPDGRRVAVGSWDTTARIFEIKRDEPDKGKDR